MLKNPIFVAVLVTIYLAIYTALFQFNTPFNILMGMFMLSPFLVIWMALVILKDKKYKSPELEEGQEWGYADRDKRRLKIEDGR